MTVGGAFDFQINFAEGKMVMLSLLVRKLKEELDETVYLDSRILSVMHVIGIELFVSHQTCQEFDSFFFPLRGREI